MVSASSLNATDKTPMTETTLTELIVWGLGEHFSDSVLGVDILASAFCPIIVFEGCEALKTCFFSPLKLFWSGNNNVVFIRYENITCGFILVALVNRISLAGRVRVWLLRLIQTQYMMKTVSWLPLIFSKVWCLKEKSLCYQTKYPLSFALQLLYFCNLNSDNNSIIHPVKSTHSPNEIGVFITLIH